MNPSLLSLIFCVFLMPLLLLGEIVPTLNLHIANDRESTLSLALERTLYLALRSSKPLEFIQKDLEKLKIWGIEIERVSLMADGEYLRADLSYKHKALFNITEQSKSMSAIAVRVDD